jgi:diguanylate cyclase
MERHVNALGRHPGTSAPIAVAIVEDNDGDFFLAKRALENAPHQTFEITRADNYDSALSLLKSRPFDVALIDYQLGAESGLDLVRALGGRNSPTPLVMLSGIANRQVDLEAMEAGAMDFLEKAELTPALLERTIRYVRHVNQSLVEFRSAGDLAKLAHPGNGSSAQEIRHAPVPASAPAGVVVGAGRDHGRTMALATIALDHIKNLQLPVDPPSYDLWYTYVTGENRELSKTIDEVLRRGPVSLADLDRIYDQYFSHADIAERLETVDKIGDEVDQVVAMVDAAIRSTETYTEKLTDAGHRLDSAGDRPSLRRIVEQLIHNNRSVEAENRDLQSRLKVAGRDIKEAQASLEAIRLENTTDPLTGLANRRHFDRALVTAVEEAAARAEPLTLLMADIDHFKKLNDSFGHLIGDHVLRLIGLVVKQSVRGRDVAARYGGEEFAIILPKTAWREARVVAENIRTAVTARELVRHSTGERLGRVTMSIGVAQLHRGEDGQALIGRADRCLYRAKHDGRNRVNAELEAG